MMLRGRRSDAGAGAHAAPAWPCRPAESSRCRATAVDLSHSVSNGAQSSAHGWSGCWRRRPGCHQSAAHHQIYCSHQDRSDFCAPIAHGRAMLAGMCSLCFSYLLHVSLLKCLNSRRSVLTRNSWNPTLCKICMHAYSCPTDLQSVRGFLMSCKVNERC